MLSAAIMRGVPGPLVRDSLDFCFLNDRVKNPQDMDQKEQDIWHLNSYLLGASEWLFPELTLLTSQRGVHSQALEPAWPG